LSKGFQTESYKPTWAVWRQEDNGNVMPVKNELAEIEALRLVREFESKGHKQTYRQKKICD
jgi:hypothetical protein